MPYFMVCEGAQSSALLEYCLAVEAAAAKPLAESRRGSGPASDLIAVAALVAITWLPVLVGVYTRALLGWLAAAALAVVVERATVRLAPRVLVGALLASSAFVPSGLVTDSTHYLPVAVTAGALAIRTALTDWRSRHIERPVAEPMALAIVAYLAWAAVATSVSIDRRVSLPYWVGTVAVCALAFWAIPRLIPRREDREFILAVLGALGVIVAGSVYVLSQVGAISIFSHRVSDYQLIDLTVGGHATGAHFGKSAGLFLAPLEPSVLMVVAVLAMLGWTSTRTGRWMWAGRAAIVVMVPAILITLDRSAWLAALMATGAFAVLLAARRSAAVLAGILCLVFTLSFFSVVANVVGANAIATSCSTGCTQAAPGSDESPLRGGTGLSGREFLWAASVRAIEHRPLFGYGPGNNVPAIDTYLTGDGLPFKGLTSHDTWLRTAVEQGVPGLLLLLGVLAVAAWTFFLGARKPPRTSEPRTEATDPTRVTFAVSVVGLLGVMTFESFFLGGVNFSNLYLALALTLMLPPTTLQQFRRSLTRLDSIPEGPQIAHGPDV
jgi:O-antigen ligase